MAEVHPINFFTTTVRAPVALTDTQLQLASGTSTPLDVIAAGDFVYLTVSDGTSAEVMKYTSTGSITADTIIVERAQDNTTAKAFPTGACVSIGWNVAQIEALVEQFIVDNPSIPANTVAITGSTNVPSGEPAVNIIYTVNVTTGQSWYWNGSSWVPLASNNVQMLPGVPSDPPTGGVTWTFNTLAGTLYFWDGAEWLLVSAEPGYLEVYGRIYLDTVTGVALAAGSDNVFSDMITDETIAVLPTYYKSNPLVVGIIVPTETNEVTITEESLVEFTATVTGAVDPTKDVRLRLIIFHAATASSFVSETFRPADSGGDDLIGVSVTTGPLQVAADDVWDCSLVVTDGGVTYAGITLYQFEMNISVIAKIVS